MALKNWLLLNPLVFSSGKSRTDNLSLKLRLFGRLDEACCAREGW